MSSDPFSLTFDKLWECVEEHPYVLQNFKVGNRIDLNDQRLSLKPTLATADLPELLLVPQSMRGNLHASSSQSSVIKRFQWIITTGDLRLNNHLHPLSWAIYTSMVRCQKELTLVEYAGHKFIRRMDLVDSTDGQSAAQRESNIQGWTQVQTIEVEMYFPSSILVTEAQES